MVKRLYLGIDGGQSSTIALIGDESGRVIGKGGGGPCNHVGAAERRAKFFSAVGDSVRVAAEQAGIKNSKDTVFTGVCAGFSGGTADKSPLLPELIRAEHYLITHDAHIALVGATAGGPGVITIAGTGSIAFGRNPEGVTARAGGWGYVFGDEGSAFDIVRQALRAILRHEEGWGPASSLTTAMLAATGAACGDELLHWCYTDKFPRERVAALAPLVDEAARAGDPVATEVLGAAAQSLATIAAAVRRQLFAEGDAVNVHFAGGVFHSEPLLARFRMLAELDGKTHVAEPRQTPAYGALLEAYRCSGTLPA
jgi:N-acetylglucosamine kinase-like BadF-type ATPase